MTHPAPWRHPARCARWRSLGRLGCRGRRGRLHWFRPRAAEEEQVVIIVSSRSPETTPNESIESSAQVEGGRSDLLHVRRHSGPVVSSTPPPSPGSPTGGPCCGPCTPSPSAVAGPASESGPPIRHHSVQPAVIPSNPLVRSGNACTTTPRPCRRREGRAASVRARSMGVSGRTSLAEFEAVRCAKFSRAAEDAAGAAPSEPRCGFTGQDGGCSAPVMAMSPAPGALPFVTWRMPPCACNHRRTLQCRASK